MTEKVDPHKAHSYSHDYLIMTALTHELNTIKCTDTEDDNLPIVKKYMEARVKEIKERWK